MVISSFESTFKWYEPSSRFEYRITRTCVASPWSSVERIRVSVTVPFLSSPLVAEPSLPESLQEPSPKSSSSRYTMDRDRWATSTRPYAAGVQRIPEQIHPLHPLQFPNHEKFGVPHPRFFGTPILAVLVHVAEPYQRPLDPAPRLQLPAPLCRHRSHIRSIRAVPTPKSLPRPSPQLFATSPHHRPLFEL